MRKSLPELLDQDCLFNTELVSVLKWDFIESQRRINDDLMGSIMKIMSPEVTKALPDDWQKIDTINKAENWIIERKDDGNFYAITLSESEEIIGFLFLYYGNDTKESKDLRLGYLLKEAVWGKGI